MTSDSLFSSKDLGLKYKVVLQLSRLCLLANFPASTITLPSPPPPLPPSILVTEKGSVETSNLFSQYNMRLHDITIFMYKVKHRLLPSNILDLFSGTRSGYNLRNPDFHISRIYSVHYGKHSLRYFGPHLWSKLGHGERQMPTLTSFVKNMRRKDLANVFSNYVCTGIVQSVFRILDIFKICI